MEKSIQMLYQTCENIFVKSCCFVYKKKSHPIELEQKSCLENPGTVTKHPTINRLPKPTTSNHYQRIIYE